MNQIPFFKQPFVRNLVFFFQLYLLGLLFFTFFRLVLFYQNIHQIEGIPSLERTMIMLEAFFMGFRFDTVIAGYLLILPLVISTIFISLSNKFELLYKIIFWMVITFYSIAFIVCAVDIPYFGHFNARLSVAALSWVDSPMFMVKMIFQETAFVIFLFVFIVVMVLYSFLLLKIYRNQLSVTSLYLGFQRNVRNLTWGIAISLVGTSVLFLGIRGRITKKSPIRIGTAYFSNYQFANLLGLNPLFTFIRSALDEMKQEKIELMKVLPALAHSQRALNINPDYKLGSPLARSILTSGEQTKANVVVVIMESMSAWKMGRYGNPDHMTPVLDSLAKISLSFDQTYSAGIHTFNGIFSTLFSYPALLGKHPMKDASMQAFTGFSNTLAQHNYQSIYFTTHDDQFDNVGGFMHLNNFQQVIAQKDYPADKILSTLGVSDDYMFDYSINYLNKMHQTGKPIFAAYMTASAHEPYIIPEGINFQSSHTDMNKRIVAYSDWAIGHFLSQAAMQPWYANTIFVFVADHGLPLDNQYDMSLAFHHSPFIIFSPKYIKNAQSYSKLAQQIDVFPTVMGLLNLTYVNNTMGIDLRKENRKYAYFSADDKIGCLSDSLYLVNRLGSTKSIYKYRKGDLKDYYTTYPLQADSMEKHSNAMIQTAAWMIDEKLVGNGKK